MFGAYFIFAPMWNGIFRRYNTIYFAINISDYIKYIYQVYYAIHFLKSMNNE